MNRIVSVVGLGYVGLPVAVAFGLKSKVIGFDISRLRVDELNCGKDSTLEVAKEDLQNTNITFTNDPKDLKQANFHIIAVPTPINQSKQPDLCPLFNASETVGLYLKKGDIVVYESTVYPGATEDDCLPILEKASQLKAGVDFFVGYSPERINPGDKQHSFTNIVKVVSGQDESTLNTIAEVYSSVVKAGVHKAPSIKAAEAAKVIENTQRDLNIALMNELAIIFRRLGIDTLDVLEAAGTKWNFLPFRPGLVGGHCIGVDPFYLTYKAQKVGHHPDVILAGRRMNDSMGRYIVGQVVKQMLLANIQVRNSRVGVMGLTFKEDCPDLRNSRVIDIINELKSYEIKTVVHDPLASKVEAQQQFGIQLEEWDALQELDAIIITTAHKTYIKEPISSFKEKLNPNGIVFDIKCILDREACKTANIPLWRL